MSYMQSKIGVQTLLCATVLFCVLFPVRAAEIRLKNTHLPITEPLVTLADIADVLPMDNENVEQLRRTVLFPTPAEGDMRTLDQWELRTMLSQLGINTLHHTISGTEKITIAGVATTHTTTKHILSVNPNEQFVIHANYLTPTGTNPVTPIAVRSEVPTQPSEPVDNFARMQEEQIANALRIYLNFTNKTERQWEIALKLSPEQSTLLATNGQITEISGGQIPFTGLQQFQIRMQTNATITVDAMVALPLEVVVARRTLPKGHIINESDVMLRRADGISGDDYIVDIESVVGREVIKPVRELSVLSQSSLRFPLWVRKGEIVTVRAMSGGITVRTEATALQDGTDGETITVAKIDLSSKKGKKEEPVTYLVRVCAPKTVEVFVNSH